MFALAYERPLEETVCGGSHTLPTSPISSTEPDAPRSLIRGKKRRFRALPAGPVNARVAYGLQREGGLPAAVHEVPAYEPWS